MSAGFSFCGFGQLPGAQSGAPATARPAGLLFSTPTSNAPVTSLTATVQTGFPLAGGVTATVTTTTSLTLGTPTLSTQQQNVTFGTTPQAGQLGGFGAATPQLGSFGTGAAATPQMGSFGTAPAPQLGGFVANATATPQLGGFGTVVPPAAAAVPQLGGFGAAATTGLGLTQVTSTATPVLSTGVTFGLQKTTGGTASSTGSTLSSLLGGSTSQTPATKPAIAFSLGQPNIALGGAATTAPAFGLNKPLTTPVTQKRGLGGTDPKTTEAGLTGTGSSKSGDSKAVKETPVLNEICSTVENFKKYVKNQKCVREQIARMSSKAMFRVAEDVASLKQLLALVSSALQRNAIAIDKLKLESAQELKHAEIAQRTKDTPPGLQYENTAPTEYFQQLVAEFEMRMVLCRQQIEEMESHLATMHQSVMLTPQELALLLHKLQESFVALAAQLQVIHEDIKSQKEHFLNYRKVFHDDSTNVFEKRKKAAERVGKRVAPAVTVGPSPFTGMSNAAAVAMAAALNRPQQPAPAVGLGLNTGAVGSSLGASSLFSTPGTAFGAVPAATPFGFGGTNTATVRPLGSSTGLFGTTTQPGGFSLTNPLSAPTGLPFGSTPGLLGGGFGDGHDTLWGGTTSE
ncbi:Nucleoporin p58/p45 [Lamellibrachia satsuma]|nr:Nucleoporin p58/p45 [Lamellibrachia satsuma]